MKKISEEATYERMRELAKINRGSIKETQNRTLGTLIDYKRAADGVAYGIIKEQHNYYIKKGGLKQDPNVADFAYIGGLENIKEFQYNKLSEAEKQRNMLFRTINEAVTSKPSKTGSKKRLNEDKAGEEIKASQEMAAGLDAAKQAPAEEPAPDFSGEPTGDAPVDAAPAPESGEEMPAAEPAPEGGEEMPAEEPAPEGDGSEKSSEENPEGSSEENPEGDEESKDDIKSDIGKVGEKVLDKTLDDKKVVDYVGMFLGYFKDNFIDMPIEDRKELAAKILEVTKDKNIDDLEANTPAEPVTGGDEEPVAEEQCAECGGFAKYAESKGYTAESIQECGEEEMTNLVSGYANAHNDGQNDGDFKAVALFITPEIIEKLKGDYGHDDYAEKITPYANEMNECGLEEKQAQINELFGNFGAGMKGVFNKGAEKVKGAATDLYNAGAEKVNQVKTGVQNVAKGVQTAYHTGALSNEMKKANELGNQFAAQINALKQRAEKAGQQIDTKKLVTDIAKQITGGGQVNVAGTKTGGALRTAEGKVDPAGIEVQPLEEIKVPEPKAGQKLSTKAPIKQIKEEEEPEVETGEEKKEISFAPEGETMGGGLPKPDGAGVQIQIEPDKSVNISMNESEAKLRKYIRNKLEEMAGLRKPVLTESKKSPTLQKLDNVIAKQFKLYEGVMLKKKQQ